MEKRDMCSEGYNHLIEAIEIYEYQRCRTFCKRKRNGMWFKIMNALNQMGNLYFQEEMIEAAGRKYNEALRASKKFVLNDDIPKDSCVSLHVADILNNLACVKAMKKDYDKAISLYNQALDLQSSTLGEVDPAVSITLHNIGTMNFRAKNYEVALKSYKQVLKMRRTIFTKDHHSIADVLIDIAAIYEKRHDNDRALRLLKESLRIAKVTYEDEHEKVIDIYDKVNLMEQKIHKKKRTDYYYELARDDTRKSCGIEIHLVNSMSSF